MIDKIIPFDIFQEVIFNFCDSKEQMILKHLFYNGIKHMDLKELYASDNHNITDECIKHMNLKKLYANYNPNITDEGIKHITNLKILYAIGNNSNITDECIKHMNNCKLYK